MRWSTLELSVLVNALTSASSDETVAQLSQLMSDPVRNNEEILEICGQTFSQLPPEARWKVAEHAQTLAKR